MLGDASAWIPCLMSSHRQELPNEDQRLQVQRISLSPLSVPSSSPCALMILGSQATMRVDFYHPHVSLSTINDDSKWSQFTTCWRRGRKPLINPSCPGLRSTPYNLTFAIVWAEGREKESKPWTGRDRESIWLISCILNSDVWTWRDLSRTGVMN